MRPMAEPTAADSRATSLVRAIAIPLVVLGLAYVLWKISDRLLVIGPFDRAAFGWTFVIPIWLAAPIVAGVAWRAMPDPVVRVAAAALAVILAVASGWLFWEAMAFPACDFGVRFTPAEMVVPTGIVGLVFGGGVAAAGLATRFGFQRYAVGRAIGLGLIATVTAFVLTFVVAVALLTNPVCQRPPRV